MWNDVQVGTKTLSSHWNRKEGSKLNLYTYTNGDEVELIVNGKSLGRRTNNVANPKEHNRIYWKDVPYAKGNIVARAYRKGENKPIATHRIETAGKAVKLTATGDNSNWKADATDLQHVRIQALDGRNRRDYGAFDKIKFTVDGPAEIVGVINGNISSDELTVGDTREPLQRHMHRHTPLYRRTGRSNLDRNSRGFENESDQNQILHQINHS